MHRVIASSGCKKQGVDVKEIGRGRHYYMIGTAASDIGQGGCELWITTKLNPVKSSITVAAHSHRWLAVNVELPKISAAIVVAHAPPRGCQ